MARKRIRDMATSKELPKLIPSDCVWVSDSREQSRGNHQSPDPNWSSLRAGLQLEETERTLAFLLHVRLPGGGGFHRIQ